MDNQTVIRLLLVVLAALILFGLVGYYNRNKDRLEAERFNSSVSAKAKQQRSMKSVDNEEEEEEERDEGGKEGFDVADDNDESMAEDGEQGDGVDEDVEQFTTGSPPAPVLSNDDVPSGPGFAGSVRPSEPSSNEQYLDLDFPKAPTKGPASSSASSARIENLLPKDASNTKWAQMNPAGQGEVNGQWLLTAGHHYGINTVGQTNKNPNLQLRTDPPNPRINVSPWMQSTVEPDLNRRPFEIGGC
jgi:FtsZ-interacting cell division protein ZipA